MSNRIAFYFVAALAASGNILALMAYSRAVERSPLELWLKPAHTEAGTVLKTKMLRTEMLAAESVYLVDSKGTIRGSLAIDLPFNQGGPGPALTIYDANGNRRAALAVDLANRSRLDLYMEDGTSTIGGMVNANLPGSLIVNGLRVKDSLMHPNGDTYTETKNYITQPAQSD